MKVVHEEAPHREAEILVALHSGLRRSEQYKTAQVPDGGLKWEHVNLRVGVIRLPRSKTGKARAIPMNSVLRHVFATLPRAISRALVFSGEPDKWFAELCAKAKITDFTWHDLRHTFGRRLAMADVHVKKIAELMGHSSIMVTSRYMHLSPEYLDDAVECLAQHSAQRATRRATNKFAVSGDDGK